MFIIVFLVVFLLINAASMRLQDTKWFKKEDGTIAKRLLLEGGGVAFATALVNRLAPVLENTWWNVFLLGVMVAGFTGLFLWWGDKDEGGTDFKDAIPFALLGLTFTLVAGGPANSLAGLIGVPGLSGVVKQLPWLAFIALLGYMAVVALLYHRDIHRDAGEPHRKFFVAAITALVIFGLLFVSSLGKAIGTPVVSTKAQTSETNQSNWAGQWRTAIFGGGSDESSSGGRTLTEFFKSLFGKNDGSKSEQPGGDGQPTQPATTEESAPTMWDVHFYHDDVTRNDIEEDDDNFGTSILDQLLLEKVQAGEIRLTDIGKGQKELIKLVTAEEYFRAVIKRMGKDPALGAAWLGTYDAYMGSDYLGKFSTELKDHPDARMELINGSVDAWCYDQSGYYAALVAFISAIEDADEVYLDYYASGLDDQMFMDGHTVDGIPNVVVMTSVNHSGVVFVVKNRIKNGDTVVTMLFRDDCGGQPTNVAEKLGVTPKANPRSTPSAPSTSGGKPSGNSSGGKPSGGSSGGKPNNDSSGGKSGNDPKNVNEGITHTNSNPTVNNDPFTGSKTGYSTAELPTNSVYADDIRDLLDEVDELKEANDDTPDYYVGLTEDTTVDTNRATGTGNGGTDTASKVSEEVTGVREDNGVKDTVQDKVGGAEASWGGPPL